MTVAAPIPRQPISASTETDVAAIERAVRIAIDALKELGIREDYAVLVGGGPLTEQSALAAGADAYCRDIPAATNAAELLLGNR